MSRERMVVPAPPPILNMEPIGSELDGVRAGGATSSRSRRATVGRDILGSGRRARRGGGGGWGLPKIAGRTVVPNFAIALDMLRSAPPSSKGAALLGRDRTLPPSAALSWHNKQLVSSVSQTTPQREPDDLAGAVPCRAVDQHATLPSSSPTTQSYTYKLIVYERCNAGTGPPSTSSLCKPGVFSPG
jgi:hypothetical protein